MASKGRPPKDDPVTMLGHELRNELGGIIFAVGHLMQTAADDEVGQNVLRSATAIKEMTDKMSRLLNELLAHVQLSIPRARNVTRQAKR